MQTEEAITEILVDLANDTPGFIAASLVDLDSGMTLGVYAKRDDFDLTSASAYNSELVKQKQKIMAALDLDMALDDLTMTLTDQIHVIQLTATGSSFVYLATDRSATNLALVRKAMANQVKRIEH
jgi:predicted regulator of Ras-like GTPase activity (Roadblock/LC7/MglB family)